MLVLSSVIWGASFFFIEIGLKTFEPGLVTFLRIGFGCATVWLLPMQRTAIDKSDWLRVGAVGMMWMAIPFTLFALAQRSINSSLAGMLDAGTLITTLIIGVVFFGSPIIRSQIVGVAVGLVGLLVISGPEVSASGTRALGVMLVLAAVVAFGVSGHLAAPLLQNYGVLPVIRGALLAATIVAAPYGVIAGVGSEFDWNSLAACAALGIGGTGFAYVFASALNRRVGSIRASASYYVIPVVSVVMGAVFLDETISAAAVVGTALVLVGAVFATTTVVSEGDELLIAAEAVFE